jgi:biopolymer transport protein ExbD
MSMLKDIASQESKMEMTPMIDVTFLLLIFFMCTLKFKTLEGKLAAYLPQDVGVNTSDAEPIEKVEIMLQVIEEGTKYMPFKPDIQPWDGESKRYVYGSDRRIRYTVGPMRTFDLNELGSRIKDMTKVGGKIRPATIDPRKGITYSDVAKVLDVVLTAGFEEVTFVGSYEKQ